MTVHWLGAAFGALFARMYRRHVRRSSPRTLRRFRRRLLRMALAEQAERAGTRERLCAEVKRVAEIDRLTGEQMADFDEERTR